MAVSLVKIINLLHCYVSRSYACTCMQATLTAENGLWHQCRIRFIYCSIRFLYCIMQYIQPCSWNPPRMCCSPHKHRSCKQQPHKLPLLLVPRAERSLQCAVERAARAACCNRLTVYNMMSHAGTALLGSGLAGQASRSSGRPARQGQTAHRVAPWRSTSNAVASPTGLHGGAGGCRHGLSGLAEQLLCRQVSKAGPAGTARQASMAVLQSLCQ